MSGKPSLLFDLGGVLIDWNPRYVYRPLFPDETAMEHFLATVCTSEWNLSMDAGKPFSEAIRERQALFPEQAGLIGLWQSRWEDMLGGAIQGTVDILEELKGAGEPLFSLTNWSAETFPVARRHYPFLGHFSRIVVSGEEGLAKPDPALFRLALERCGLEAGATLFIDDNLLNVEAARAVGMEALRFTDPGQLRRELQARGFLEAFPR